MSIGCFPDMQAVFLISLPTFQIQQIASLLHYRLSPGILSYQGKAYLFGGLNDIRSKFSEMWAKSPGKWRLLPDMACQRANFIPCLHGKEVILLSFHTISPILEVFDIEKELFRVISLIITVSEPSFSCQFMLNEDLIVLSETGLIIQWEFGQIEVKTREFVPSEQMRSSGQTVIYGKSVYFAGDSRGKLLCFDLDREEVHAVTDFTNTNALV
jgi:hypothetical protein